MRNLTTKINDTAPAATGYIDAAEFNSTQDELENATTAAPGGQTLDASAGPDSSTAMLAQSITRHAAGGAIYCTATGSASAHVVSMADGNVKAPNLLFKGLTCRYDPPAANATSAVTVNAFGLGAKALVNHVSAPLSSTEIDGRVIDIYYDPAIGSGSWVLPAWSNALYVGQTPSSPPSVSTGEGVEIDGSNLANLNFPGLTGDSSPQSADTFAFYDDADAEHKAITYAQLASLLGVGGGIKGVQLITASGTYTKTSGTNKLIAFATGGGGGGGYGYSGLEGAGGSAGGTAIAFVDVSGVSTVACTIGAGGTGGVGGNGSAGGSTSFGTHATATGGGGGETPGTVGGADAGARSGQPGIGTVGLMLFSGGPGVPTGIYERYGGNGGDSFWGGGGRGGDSPASVLPEAGRSYGAGGGGGDGNSSASVNQNGAAGASGCILVVEFG